MGVRGVLPFTGEDELMAAAASEREDTTTASLALYRKYRPATFAEVKGQEHVTGPLQQALRTGPDQPRLPVQRAARMRQDLQRADPRPVPELHPTVPTPEPCGVCDSCVALAPSGPGSIDVIEIDAASHGGVDDARELRERAFYTPVSGRFKIYIIDEAHMVTQQGFNALLKLVEEPPPHLKFIFATTEPEKVIPTIRSRTHHYPFRLVAPSVLRELMQDILRAEGVAVEDAVLPLVARAGAGSVRDSLSVLDQLLAGSDGSGLRYDRAVALLGYTDASLLDEIVDAFAAADGAAVFEVVNRVIEGGHEPRRFAADLLDRFRDLIILAAVPHAAETGLLDLPPDRAEQMAAQAGRFGQAGLTRAAEIVSTGLDQMRGATSPRLLLELMCAQVLLPAAATDEKSLLARLERLESAGRGTPVRFRPHPRARRVRMPENHAERASAPAPADRDIAAPAGPPCPGLPRSARSPAGPGPWPEPCPRPAEPAGQRSVGQAPGARPSAPAAAQSARGRCGIGPARGGFAGEELGCGRGGGQAGEPGGLDAAAQRQRAVPRGRDPHPAVPQGRGNEGLQRERPRRGPQAGAERRFRPGRDGQGRYRRRRGRQAGQVPGGPGPGPGSGSPAPVPAAPRPAPGGPDPARRAG